ncbi:hypothetical protein BKH46_05895 [Helicobacter sp. 12S02634-8]|uniref:FapA family protein n=1 Tax=Helicobacter sp. 12S02634-8 TaxID=1476199 RepID=UPI000BA544BF|nr:FapA family protein [Helicobacter sp. 12S02634-8]PAF46968.1 hypothetical protein BKH46_05895 [Helicobacter sp. 12S02634-8]
MEAPSFIPQVIRNCEDVNKELQKFSLASKIHQDYLWFDVLNFQTLIKTNEKDGYQPLSGNALAQFEKDDFYIKDNFSLLQTYDIRIYPKTKDYKLKLELTPQADKLYLVFDEHFIIINDDQFFEEIFSVIDSLMAQNKVIFRQQYEQRENLKAALKNFQAQGAQPQKLLLKTAPDFIPHTPSEFRFLLKNAWEKDKGTKAPKNSLFGTSPDVSIAEYIKPIKGKNGRNLKGLYIKIDIKDIDQMPPLSYNKNFIQREETSEKIVFKSLINGYVKIENDTIIFNTDYEFTSMKTTNAPMLLGGVESGITLVIKSEDEFSDAVGSNMILEASKIQIIGSVGENVTLSAQEISIQGQTHQSTTIKAQEAKVTTHKGRFLGEHFSVRNLDTGFIQASDCSIEVASGATIYAKKIAIKTLKSNNKLHFSQECELQEIQGGENRFVISSGADIKTKQVMEFIHKKIALLKSKMHTIAQEYQLFVTKAKKNKPIIDKIKSADKTTQIAMLAENDIKRTYDQFIAHIKKLKVLKRELIGFQNNIKDLNASLLEIENETLGARILAKSEWRFENEVIYHQDYPKPNDEILILADGENIDIRIDPLKRKMIKTH